MAKPTIAVIGLGYMGTPMSRNLMRAGFELRGFDVDPSRVKALQEAGAAGCSSPAQAAQGADFALTMLPSSQHVREALEGEQGVFKCLRRGAVIIQTSSIAPTVTKALGKAAVEKGFEYLDAPVSRGVPAVERGELLIMVGGTEEALSQAAPVLNAIGSDVVHLGPVGTAAAMKVVNNLILGITIATAAEAVTLGVKAGIQLEKLLEVLAGASGDLWVLRNLFPSAFAGVYTTRFKVDHMLKDLLLAEELGADICSPTLLGSLAKNLFLTVSAQGAGGEDCTSILKNFETFANTKVRYQTPVGLGKGS